MFFHKKEEIATLGKMYLSWEHKYWGDNIVFNTNDSCSGYGFGNYSKGDIIAIEMQSGKVGGACITNIRYERDPSDMFFFNYKIIGYINKLGQKPFFIKDENDKNILLNSDKEVYNIPECMKPNINCKL